MIPPIVDVDWLKNHPEAVLADVRWYLDGRSGAQAYASGHLPGAVFLDIDTDLSAPPSAEGGRHPLPDPEDFASAMVDAGISDDSVVVAYDDFGGFSAGRLVWMLRSLGVDAALLDGGIDAWDGPLSTEEPEETDEDVTFGIRGWGPDVIASIDEAVAGPMVVRDPDFVLFDGIRLQAGSSFPGLIGVESDRYYPGHQTPADIEVPTLSPIECRGKGTWSTMTYYSVPSGASVFATGTMSWTRSLTGPSAKKGITKATSDFTRAVTATLLEKMADGSLPAARRDVPDLADYNTSGAA